ncbi:hypothetical protein [Thermomonas sp.]|uniref:hypothetical protein n=1 Tax=Thermomonas sp. TaxID=1971895 RepID=UPI0035B164D8
MKPTVVGLVTPHVLRVMDLARQAETGVSVELHLRDAVARTVHDLGQQFNAGELLRAYVQGLETVVREATPARKVYLGVLQVAVAQATRSLPAHD